MEFRNRYSTPDQSPTYVNVGPSLTKQAMADECDINKVLEKYQKTGVLPIVEKPALYGDYSNAVSYQEALNLASHAADQFNNLSAKVRNKFENDPAKFLEFCGNESNHDEMVKLGLLNKPTPEVIEPTTPPVETTPTD